MPCTLHEKKERNRVYWILFQSPCLRHGGKASSNRKENEQVLLKKKVNAKMGMRQTGVVRLPSL
jgi:hypothetical protein